MLLEKIIHSDFNAKWFGLYFGTSVLDISLGQSGQQYAENILKCISFKQNVEIYIII